MLLSEWENQLGQWSWVDDALPMAVPASGPSHYLESIEQSAMACEFEVLLNQGQYPQGIEHARDALRVVHGLEEMLSVYRSTSDFSTINRFGHLRPVGTRHDVLQLLEVARAVSVATGRAFDITAGALSQAWGFSRRQGRRPNDDELAAVLERVGAELVEVDRSSGTVHLLREGVELNPGGIGKGYALDRVACQLVTSGVHDFLLHGGRSSILARGQRWDQAAVDWAHAGQHHPPADGNNCSGWWIALAHPLRWEEKLGRLRLCNQALGTSGAGKQFFHYRGVRYSHVIDPRSGWPAQGALSATAICRSATLADALATAFMVMGVDATAQFCQQHPTIGAIMVSQQPHSSRLSIECFNTAARDWEPR